MADPLPSKQGVQPADALLRVVAGEMSKLVNLALDLQRVNPAAKGGRRAEDIKAYQGLDYITQSLQALMSVCEDMAENTPTDWVHDELKSVNQVTLAGLKSALKLGHTDPVSHSASDGVVDLFDV